MAHLLLRFAEQSLRAKKQNDEEQNETDDFAIRRANRDAADGFRKPEKDRRVRGALPELRSG